ncbi:YopX family protein [Lactococcus lactis]
MIPKLRAWDKQDERMRTVSSINFAHEVISCKFAELKPFDLVDEFSIDDVILMQSTGIKDKNGVEIYEGDILKLHAIFLAPDDKIGYLEYSPKYGYSIIFEGNRLYRQEYWASTNKLNYEVIGNIYENPELLEGDKK